MPDIAIDAGNTSIKLGVFNSDGSLDVKYDLNEFDLIKIVNGSPESKVIIASVGSTLVNFFNLVQDRERIFLLNDQLKLPVKNEYKTPQTLGPDRLAAVCGAWDKMPKRDILIIDSGTCITFDFINKAGEYLGGMISPGLNLRYKSLNEHTNRLPLFSKTDMAIDLIGENTEQSIRSGVQNGLLFEINGTIQAFKSKYPDLHVFICGGDAGIFESKINHPIFADPNLVLSGLHAILKFNFP
ncbi:MAG: type III pantothenate kinase [Cytophagales bacterium]|nr:type III pantothenate kinase [Cytophagales bacterium]